MKKSFCLAFSLCLFILSCTNDKLTIEEKLLQKCKDAHGGMDKWKSMTSTHYSKKIVLYHEDGSVEKELNQTHHYSTVPKLSGSIEWSDSLPRKIKFEEEKAFKINGRIKEEPSQSALNSFNSAYYVLNMPWKLLDSSAEISYLGLDTILNNKIVHTLKVEYPTEKKQDVWEYYLDEKKHYLVANMVHHGTTYSLITNDEYATYKGLKFNSKRTSYMVDSTGKVLYTRAKYEYIYKSE